jgi:hypothetical protein
LRPLLLQKAERVKVEQQRPAKAVNQNKIINLSSQTSFRTRQVIKQTDRKHVASTALTETIERVETIEKDGRLCLVMVPTRSRLLKECIIQNGIQDIGKIKPMKKMVNLNADRKQFWLGALKAVGDGQYNDSLALSLNRFGKDEI